MLLIYIVKKCPKCYKLSGDNISLKKLTNSGCQTNTREFFLGKWCVKLCPPPWTHWWVMSPSWSWVIRVYSAFQNWLLTKSGQSSALQWEPLHLLNNSLLFYNSVIPSYYGSLNTCVCVFVYVFRSYLTYIFCNGSGFRVQLENHTQKTQEAIFCTRLTLWKGITPRTEYRTKNMTCGWMQKSLWFCVREWLSHSSMTPCSIHMFEPQFIWVLADGLVNPMELWPNEWLMRPSSIHLHEAIFHPPPCLP